VAQDNSVIEVWEGVLTIRIGTDVTGILSVVRDRFVTAKEGVLMMVTGEPIFVLRTTSIHNQLLT